MKQRERLEKFVDWIDELEEAEENREEIFDLIENKLLIGYSSIIESKAHADLIDEWVVRVITEKGNICDSELTYINDSEVVLTVSFEFDNLYYSVALYKRFNFVISEDEIFRV